MPQDVIPASATTADPPSGGDTSPTPRPPALEIFIDIPNFEHALHSERLPSQLLYAKLGGALAGELPGGPYYVKNIWCFASTREFDPITGIGTLRDEPYVSHLRSIALSESRVTHLVLSHRLQRRSSSADAWEEKGVDVNLATYMMEGACDSRYDVAMLLANDSDYAGLSRRVIARGKQVIWGCLGRQAFGNDHLANAVTRPYHLSDKLVRRCKAV